MGDKPLTLLEAMDNLTMILEAPSLDQLTLDEQAHLALTEEEQSWGIEDDQHMLDVIAASIGTVEHHVKRSYSAWTPGDMESPMLREMEQALVLVGEVAHRLQQSGSYLHHFLTTLPAYRHLQDLYQNKLVTWLRVHPTWQKQVQAAITYPLNDLAQLQADTIYELFYLRGEEGRAFFSPELANRICLACDFTATGAEDPLTHVKNWEDLARQKAAEVLLKRIDTPLHAYFAAHIPKQDDVLVHQVNNCLMALMLAAQPHQLLRQLSVKGCTAYYEDFLLFLKEIVQSRAYQHGYHDPVFFLEKKPLFELVQQLIHAFFHSPPYREEVWNFLQTHVSQGLSERVLDAQLLKQLFDRCDALLAQHPQGPLLKAIDIIRHEEEIHGFDPLLLGCLPEEEGQLRLARSYISIVRMGSPTTQEMVHQARITDEFKEYLRGCQNKIVLINLQDRRGWQEKARAIAVEQLSTQSEFVDQLMLITLPIQTDFYEQQGEYTAHSDSSAFMHHLLRHLAMSECFFSPALRLVITESFLTQLVQRIHQHYFDGRTTLTTSQRRAFISIVFNMLILKSLDVSKARELIIVSKDGLDLAIMEIIQLMLLVRPKLGSKEGKALLMLLFGPLLVAREREMVGSCCQRLLDVMEVIEQKPGLEGLAGLLSPAMCHLELWVANESTS